MHVLEVYVCVRACLRVCACVRTCASTFMHVCNYMITCVWVSECVCIYCTEWTRLLTVVLYRVQHVAKRVCVYVCVRAYAHVCVHVLYSVIYSSVKNVAWNRECGWVSILLYCSECSMLYCTEWTMWLRVFTSWWPTTQRTVPCWPWVKPRGRLTSYFHMPLKSPSDPADSHEGFHCHWISFLVSQVLNRESQVTIY